MRYKEIASKIMYMMMVVTVFLVLCFLTFIFYKSLYADELVLFFIILGLISIVMLQIFFFYNKFIYGKIDMEKQVFLFGNLFMDNEIPLNDVEYVGRMTIYRSVHKIRMSGKVYYYLFQGSESDNYFRNA